MTPRVFISRWRCGCAGLLLVALVTFQATAASPKRILILDSFGRDVAPFNAVVSSFRTTLTREFRQPLDVYEAPLDMARFADNGFEAHFVDFIEHGFSGRSVDLVVPIGAPAVRFVAQYRERLFSETPILFTAVDPRLVPPGVLQTNATLVTQKLDLPGMIEDVLQLQPNTTNIMVVFGVSPLEKFWVEECRREWQVFTNRLSFSWLDSLSLEQIQERLQKPPPRSFIFFGMLLMDAARVPYENDEPLKALHGSANSPIYGCFESQLGLGTIGGRLYQESQVGALAARVALRILRGERPGDIAPQIISSSQPTYDWRELHRWGISEARLPGSSVIKFRQPTFWEIYRWRVTAILALCLGEAALIVQLLASLVKRRRTERALRDSEEQFRLLVEQAPEAVIVYDLEHERLVQVNAQAERLFGCSRQELLAPGPQRFYIAEQPDGQTIKETMFAHGERALRGETVVLERMISNAAGQRLHCEVRLVALPAGEGKLLRASFIDITERKAVEAALRESADDFRALTTTTTDGFWIMDAKGRILDANDECCRVYGYSRAEMLTKSVNEFEATESPAETRAHIERIMATGFARFETHHRCKDGRILDVEVSTTYRPRSGTFFAFIRNLTERKQAEVEAQRQREELAHVARVSTMGELATSVAHELNQPLGAILSNAEAAELFLKQDPPPFFEIQAILQDIRKDDERAGEVIRRMRTLLRKHELERQPLDINYMVKEVFRLVSADSAMRKTAIRAELAPDLPPVQGDRVHLQQVFLNLIMNGMEAMTKQPPEKRRLVVRTSLNGDGIELSVTDSGPGIEPDKLGRLFEPFFTTKQHGLGIGLSIARRIVDAHHGRIWAENQPEGGAIFRVQLPVVSEETQ